MTPAAYRAALQRLGLNQTPGAGSEKHEPGSAPEGRRHGAQGRVMGMITKREIGLCGILTVAYIAWAAVITIATINSPSGGLPLPVWGYFACWVGLLAFTISVWRMAEWAEL
jgi:hypothetical protein